MGTRRALGVMAAVALLAACERELGPAEPAGHLPFTPPPRYQAWWQAVEACTGTTGDLASIEWRVVPDAAVFEYAGRWANGLWLVQGNRIILAEAAALDGDVVRHEMLHALTGRARHTRRAFVDLCNGVVTCGEECRAEAGAGVDPPDGPPYDRAIRVARWSKEARASSASRTSRWASRFASSNPTSAG